MANKEKRAEKKYFKNKKNLYNKKVFFIETCTDRGYKLFNYLMISFLIYCLY